MEKLFHTNIYMNKLQAEGIVKSVQTNKQTFQLCCHSGLQDAGEECSTLFSN